MMESHNTTIGGCHEAFEFFAGLAGGVAPLLAGFEANLRDLKNGHMPTISHIPLTFEEVQTPKVQNLQFEPLEGMTDLIGEDGIFEEKGDDWEVIEHCEHCEHTMSLQSLRLIRWILGLMQPMSRFVTIILLLFLTLRKLKMRTLLEWLFLWLVTSKG